MLTESQVSSCHSSLVGGEEEDWQPHDKSAEEIFGAALTSGKEDDKEITVKSSCLLKEDD